MITPKIAKTKLARKKALKSLIKAFLASKESSEKLNPNPEAANSG